MAHVLSEIRTHDASVRAKTVHSLDRAATEIGPIYYTAPKSFSDKTEIYFLYFDEAIHNVGTLFVCVCGANFLFTLLRYSICNLEAAVYHEKKIAIFVGAQ
jgi:hypothetical protein